MAQKSILSFFKKTPAKVAVEPNDQICDNKPEDTHSDSEDVPSKTLGTVKKRRRIISSSDDEDSPKKNENSSPLATNGKKSRPSDSPAVGKVESPPKMPEMSVPVASPKSKEKKKRSPKAKKESTPPDKKEVSQKKYSSDGVETSKKCKENAKNSVAKHNVSKTPKKEASAENGDQAEAADQKPSPSTDTKTTVEDMNSVSSPSPKAAAKSMHTFFTNKKEIKVQSAGDGHDGSDYNPGKSKYHPVNDAFWKHGETVPYLALTKTFEQIEAISGRLRMIEVLANFFRSVIVLSPDDLVACVYLCQNQLAPAYVGLELGIAETSLMKVIAQTTGRSLAQIKADAKNTGDLGLVAEQSKSNQRMMFVPAPLTVKGVFAKIKDISKMSGSSAMNKKIDKIQAIFVACRHSEAKYFIRSLLGKLRIGLAEQSVLQALSQACALTPPNQKDRPPSILTAVKGESAVKSRVEEVALQIKTTYCQCPNFDKIIAVLLADGVEALLEKCQMTPSVPLKPMLAHPTKGIQEVLQRFDGIKFTCEYKYDGERAQIHIADDGSVSIYSRNQENNTSKYPDIIGRIDSVKGPSVKSCILDCEAVAWDTEKKRILPFQILSTRKRKDANEGDIKVKVCVFIFDCLYLNGEPLVTRSFVERRRLLMENFVPNEGEWQFATSLDTNDTDELQQFLEESIKGNCEGLMVKTLEHEATYEIAKRSRNWLKIKKDYLSGVGDSLDLVVIGGYHGRGKRAGTYGGFLLACYDSENEQYQSICKIGTGFSDEDLQKHSEFLRQNVIKEPKSYYCYDTSHEPDEWFNPVQVWEVLCADLSLSPVHKAAMGIIDPEKGISLRFPRFIRIRDDKSVDDATSAQQVADMYSNQDQIKNQDKSLKDFEEDFY